MSPLAPLLLCWVGGVVFGFLDGRRRRVALAASAVLAAAAACTALLLADTLRQGEVVAWTAAAPPLGIALRADALGASYALASLLVLVAACAWEGLGRPAHRGFPGLVLFLGTGLTGLFLTGDAFNLYVFFEVSMTAGFVLAGYGRGALELRNALIFTVMSVLGSMLFLGAVASLYHLAGTLDLRELEQAVALRRPLPPMPLLGGAMLAAFSLKAGLFPFHGWVVPVYGGTRPPVAAILSGALANVGSFGMLRFGPALFEPEIAAASTALLALGAVSIVYGGLLALGCPRPSVVLAYSSVTQAGYVLGGLALGPAGYAATLLYTLSNSLNKTLLFLTLQRHGSFSGVPGAVGAMSLSGLPPTFGFVGKAALFHAAVAGGSPGFAAAIVAGTGLMLMAAFRSYRATPAEGGRALRSRVALAWVLAAAVLLAGLWPGGLVALAWRVGEAL